MRERYSQLLCTPEHLNYSFQRLIQEQIEELKTRNFPYHRLDTRKRIFAWFKKSAVFNNIYQEALNFLAMPRTSQEIQNNRGRFAGKIFEEAAYSYLSNIQPPTCLVLSPKRTRLFFSDLLGEELIPNPYSLDSLPTPPPDGLIIESVAGKHRATTLCEYTLFARTSRLKKKFRGFNAMRRRFPNLFSKTSLLYVVPKETSLPTFSGVKFKTVPFTHHQLKNYINGIYQHFRIDSHSATLVEVNEEAELQYSRVLDRLKQRSLTPQYAHYLSRTDPTV